MQLRDKPTAKGLCLLVQKIVYKYSIHFNFLGYEEFKCYG